MASATINEAVTGYNSQQFSDILEENGIKISFDASRDNTTLVVQTIASNLDLATNLVVDMLKHPIFADDDVARIKQEVLTNIAYLSQNHSSVVKDEWWGRVFANNSLSHPVIGYEADISKLSRQDLLSFVEQLRQSHINISIAGDIKTSQATDIAEKLYDIIDNNINDRNYAAKYVVKPIKNVAFPSTECAIMFGHEGVSEAIKIIMPFHYSTTPSVVVAFQPD